MAWPASSGAVSCTLPWNLMVAVRAATVRMAYCKNADIELREQDEPGRARIPPLQRRRPGRGVEPHVSTSARPRW